MSICNLVGYTTSEQTKNCLLRLKERKKRLSLEIEDENRFPVFENHVKIKKDGDALWKALEFKLDGQKKRGRLKMT